MTEFFIYTKEFFYGNIYLKIEKNKVRKFVKEILALDIPMNEKYSEFLVNELNSDDLKRYKKFEHYCKKRIEEKEEIDGYIEDNL